MLNCIVIDFKKKEANINDVHLSFVGILGLEPRMTGPESVVLPLHHIPMFAKSELYRNKKHPS